MFPVHIIDVLYQLVVLLFASRLDHADQLCFQLGYFTVDREQDAALVLAASGVIGVSIGNSVVVVDSAGTGIFIRSGVPVSVPLAVILIVSVVALILILIAAVQSDLFFRSLRYRLLIPAKEPGYTLQDAFLILASCPVAAAMPELPLPELSLLFPLPFPELPFQSSSVCRL